ncbi:hypothetical protein GH714_000475 [Hevea brasiliensis]|uniref:Pentacotripeptide-repeat region of PRORP domain-containing protein n=1 Tax=Hevea brasiliensis TaxID=3981 RepID=A0A6A6LAF9_HEVBR|nr:hypothetical protein GH714_000475 [Hevea brasiliensis]
MIKHGKEPDLFTYNSLLNGLCLRGQTDDALKPFELMVNRGIEVNDVSYNMLINGYRKCRKRTRNGNASIVLASSAVLGLIVESPARMMKDEKFSAELYLRGLEILRCRPVCHIKNENYS